MIRHSVLRIQSEYEARIATTGRIRDARRATTPHGRRKAIDLTNSVAFAQFNAARDCINQLTELLAETAAADQALAATSHRRATWRSAGVTILSLVIGAPLTWFVGIRLARTLKTVVRTLSVNAGEASSAAGQISNSSQQLAQGASSQAAALEEVSSMVRRNAEHTEKARSLAQQTREAADHGSGEMRRMTEAVNAIASQQQSQGITQITGAVTNMDKTTQTNAATAEESASAAEELTAQTLCLNEAIGELNRLVGARLATGTDAAVRSPVLPAAP